MHQLEKFLLPRIEAVQRGEFNTKDLDGIIAEAERVAE